MRLAFAETLADLASRDERIILLTGDLGFRALEPFSDRHPHRFFNVGVAEQNMIGVATGLAEAGFLPFCYSIVPFVLLRAYEFIRNGPVLHGMPVRIVGVGAGFDYGTNGFTHYGIEDLAVARVQPGLAVFAPADAEQLREILQKSWALPGPAYYRIGRDDRTKVPGLSGHFEFGRIAACRPGDDVLILTTSTISANAVAAAELLEATGVTAAVAVIPQISPVPLSDLLRVLPLYKTVVTVENHSISGGLGSMVAEIIAEEAIVCRLLRCGIRYRCDGASGSTAFLNDRHGLSPDGLCSAIAGALARPR